MYQEGSAAMDTTEATEAPAPEMQEPAPIANRYIIFLRWLYHEC